MGRLSLNHLLAALALIAFYVYAVIDVELKERSRRKSQREIEAEEWAKRKWG